MAESMTPDGPPIHDRPISTTEYKLSLEIEIAANRALENLREIRRRQWLGLIGIASTLAIIFTSIAGFLVNELLDLRVRDRVEETIDQELSETRFNLAIAHHRLSSSILETELATEGVGKDELERISRELDSLVITYINDPAIDADVRHGRSGQIVPILEQLIDISASGGADRFVDAFYRIAPEPLETSDSVTQTMVQHTGRRLIEDIDAPTAWKDDTGAYSEDYQRYRTFADRAKTTGYPELFLAYELVMRHMEGAPRSEIVTLIREASSLNDLDKSHFVQLMLSHATGSYSHVPTTAMGRVMQRFNAFLDAYRDEMEWIYEVPSVTS